MGAAVYIVLEDGSAPPVDGRHLGRHLDLLDHEAEALGCRPLMEFFTPEAEESDLAVDLGVELPESEHWFDPAAGLATVRAYLEALPELSLDLPDFEGTQLDLRALESALEIADQSQSRWHLFVDL